MNLPIENLKALIKCGSIISFFVGEVRYEYKRSDSKLYLTMEGKKFLNTQVIDDEQLFYKDLSKRLSFVKCAVHIR